MITLRHTLALVALISSSFALLAAPDATEQAATLHKIFQDIKAENKGAPLSSAISTLRTQESFTEEELLAVCEAATKQLIQFDDEILESENYQQFQKITKDLLTQLKGFKISGVGFASHPSFSIIYGPQDFNTDLVFKNAKGETRSKTFNLKYHSVGIQAALAWRFDLIFAINTDLSLYSTCKPLEFGTGFVGGFVPFIHPGFTILPFKDEKGSLLILHLCGGLHSPISAAIVMDRGTFTPVTKK